MQISLDSDMMTAASRLLLLFLCSRCHHTSVYHGYHYILAEVFAAIVGYEGECDRAISS